MKKDIFAGVFLGLLIGFMVGLSMSNVTGLILGALTSLLAAFFGFKENSQSARGNQVLIGTFSLSCLIAVFFGIYMRTQNVLSPSLNEEVKVYQELGFSTDEIKKIVLLEKTGLVPKDFEFNKDAKSFLGETVLMASSSNEVLLLCNNITDSSTLMEIKELYMNAGLKYQGFLEDLESVSKNDDETKEVLLLINKLLCSE
ncbi:hypothetical protein [Algoriphagus jejuensis]